MSDHWDTKDSIGAFLRNATGSLGSGAVPGAFARGIGTLSAKAMGYDTPTEINGYKIPDINQIKQMNEQQLNETFAGLSAARAKGNVNKIPIMMYTLASNHALKQMNNIKQALESVGIARQNAKFAPKPENTQKAPDSNTTESMPDVKVQPWAQSAGSVTRPEEYRNAVADLAAGSPDYLFSIAANIYKSMSPDEQKSTVAQAALKDYTKAWNATYKRSE